MKKKIFNKNRGNYAAATSSNDNYDVEREYDPIKTDTSDSNYFLDNDDAIIFDLNKKKNDNA